ncbi:MAG: hypothetical protein B1H04_05135 [Planctomycetales bacterium 4484_123]|nr:MAG: hypothetical protein B1H04_05135 [Planctomycetales bacterium 4484_123]
MMAMLRIEPVPQRRQEAALALLAGPACPCGLAGALRALLSGPSGEECLFWWARDRGAPRAAAITVTSPGRTAVVYYSPPVTVADMAVLVRLLAELTLATLDRGVAFVQCLLPAAAWRTWWPGTRPAAGFVRSAGSWPWLAMRSSAACW